MTEKVPGKVTTKYGDVLLPSVNRTDSGLFGQTDFLFYARVRDLVIHPVEETRGKSVKCKPGL